MRSDGERLIDILEAADQIGKYAAKGREALEADELIQNWMIRHIQIVGEAASRLSEKCRAAHPGIPWRDIIGMRNILVHNYFGVDLKAVWKTIDEDIPKLKRALAGQSQDAP